MTVYCPYAAELRSNNLYVTLYVHWMYFFIYYLFPFLALVVFNAAIYQRVRTTDRLLLRLTVPLSLRETPREVLKNRCTGYSSEPTFTITVFTLFRLSVTEASEAIAISSGKQRFGKFVFLLKRLHDVFASYESLNN